MIDKTRWLGLGPWHEDNESELIDWTAQPQYKGLVKGDYYHAELRYSGRWGDPGHKGELDVVFDDDGKIAFNPAVELSYLDSYQQRAVLDAMALNDCAPSHAQSIRLKKLAQEGLTMLVVTHEMSFARAVASNVVFMDQGVICEQGKPEDVLGAPKTERLKAFLASML